MFKAIKRWWKYLTAKVNQSFNERADPKVQLEQAIMEAQEQHRRLKEQAANVIANQKQTELRLNRAMEELEKLNGNARQAVLMADEAAKKGDATKATEYTSAAESFANRLIQLEAEIEDLKAMHLQATQASDQAKAAVQQNSHGAAEEAVRAPAAPRPARPGEDGRADEQGDGLAVGDRRRGRPHPRRGARQDRGPLRQGQGHVGAHRDVGREPDARDRAGGPQHRGPGPPGRDPGPARPGAGRPPSAAPQVEQPAAQPQQPGTA